MTTINEPKQARSIEKKEKILKAGFQLIIEKGYHHTNTAEIAKAAGVSTGIVYRYFKDKKDILLQAVELTAAPMFSELVENIEKVKTIEQLKTLITTTTDMLLKYHTIRFDTFQPNEFRELKAISMMDEDFNHFYNQLEGKICGALVVSLRQIGLKESVLQERAYMAWGMIDDFCDRSIRIRELDMDLDFIKEKTVAMVLSLFDELEETP